MTAITRLEYLISSVLWVEYKSVLYPIFHIFETTKKVVFERDDITAYVWSISAKSDRRTYFTHESLISTISLCTVPKYRAAVDYTPRLRAPRNLPRCTANSDTHEAVANHSPGSATANSYLGTTST